MEDPRPDSPEEPPQDLWSSILDSVSSSRSIPSKQVLLLGESSSGKSTIASALLQKPPIDDKEEQARLCYTLARLSVYTVPSSAHAHLALLPHFVPPRAALPHSAVMIVLDWTKPWTFVEQLQIWLRWVEAWVKGDGSRELEVVREDNRERLQSHIQYYAEPASESMPTTSTLGSTLLPLSSGTLTHNFSGVPIIVVCTKADLIDEGRDLVGGASGMGGMVKGKGSEWEEQTDGIMQVLRVICLKYGASLFYTTPTPPILHHLRQYALHMLFVPPAPAPGLPSAEAVAPHRNPFPFVEKPNILDRDRILVPSGWDSWGKIAVLRDGFDAKLWGEAWDNDLEAGADAQEVNGSEPRARALYADLVPDRGIKPHPLPPFNEPMPEQTFLSKNYEENAKKGDRDPRAAFRNQNELPGQIAAGIVGPMGSSSFNLPNVERALTEMEGGFSASTAGERKPPRRDVPARATSTLAGAGLGQSTASRPGLGASALAGAPSPVASGQSQHEVLQNFFQSLLSSRGDRAASPALPRAATPAQNGQTTGQNGQPVSQNGQPAAQNGNATEGSEPNGTSSGAE
ncbi:dynein light intermediate chain-domain-containing protein [Phellopilus nigrolimitatus]|nr:dynein light intermediate chain-domain-containing protein [Phellopilus nigrolimitatus]